MSLFILTHSHQGMGLAKGTVMVMSTNHNPLADMSRDDTRRTGVEHIPMLKVNGDGCVYSIPVSVIKPYSLNEVA